MLFMRAFFVRKNHQNIYCRQKTENQSLNAAEQKRQKAEDDRRRKRDQSADERQNAARVKQLFGAEI